MIKKESTLSYNFWIHKHSINFDDSFWLSPIAQSYKIETYEYEKINESLYNGY